MKMLSLLLALAQMPTAIIEGPRSADVSMVIAPPSTADYEIAPWPLRVEWNAVPNVSGYVLYLGPSVGVYTQRIVVGTPTSFVTEPGAGTWHVAVSAYREGVGAPPVLTTPQNVRLRK